MMKSDAIADLIALLEGLIDGNTDDPLGRALQSVIDYLKQPGLVMLTPEIIYQLGLAIEDGRDEEEQREVFGDATVDWINAVTRDNQEAVNQYWRSLPLPNDQM